MRVLCPDLLLRLQFLLTLSYVGLWSRCVGKEYLGVNLVVQRLNRLSISTMRFLRSGECFGEFLFSANFQWKEQSCCPRPLTYALQVRSLLICKKSVTMLDQSLRSLWHVIPQRKGLPTSNSFPQQVRQDRAPLSLQCSSRISHHAILATTRLLVSSQSLILLVVLLSSVRYPPSSIFF